MSLHVKSGLASRASAITPAASGAAADVPEIKIKTKSCNLQSLNLPECFIVQLPYKSVVATPALLLAPTLPDENVDATIEEHDSS